jgi:hypothetical protein
VLRTTTADGISGNDGDGGRDGFPRPGKRAATPPENATLVLMGERDEGRPAAARADGEESSSARAPQEVDGAPVLTTRVLTGERDEGRGEDGEESSSAWTLREVDGARMALFATVDALDFGP